MSSSSSAGQRNERRRRYPQHSTTPSSSSSLSALELASGSNTIDLRRPGPTIPNAAVASGDFATMSSSRMQQNTAETTTATLHKLLVGVTAVYSTFYAGAFFGWGPMQLMLEDDGAFVHLCPSTFEEEEEATKCPAQTSRLLNVQLVAQFTLITSPVMGIIVDRFGPLRLYCLVAAVTLLGLFLLTLSAWLDGADNLLFATFLLVGLGTVSGHQAIMQTGVLFEGVTQQRIISVMNALFDSGATTYWLLWLVHDSASLDLVKVSIIYLSLAVLVCGSSLFLWYKITDLATSQRMRDQAIICDSKELVVSEDSESGVHYTPAQLTPQTTRIRNDPSLSSTTEDQFIISVCGSVEDFNEDDDSRDGRIIGARTTRASNAGDDETKTPANMLHHETDAHQEDGEASYVLIASRTPRRQLSSRQFLLLLFFFAFHGGSNTFSLTTARDFLAYMGDDQVNNKYLTIFTLLTPVSVVGLPFQDYVLNRYGYHVGLQVINGLALLYGAIKISFPNNLNAQIAGFCVFTFFRCFLFTITLSFAPTFLSKGVVGRGTGLMVLMQGLAPAVNIPLAWWAVNKLDGNFFIPNAIYTAGVVPFIWVAWEISKGMKREALAKEQLRRQHQHQPAPDHHDILYGEEKQDRDSFSDIEC